MKRANVFLSVLFVMCCAGAASASVFGEVRGTVVDPQQQSIVAARITLQSRTSSFTLTTETNNDAEFTFPAHFGILRISVMWPINTPSWAFIITWTLICFASYLSAAMLLSAIQAARQSRYSWVLVSVVGSFVLALVYTFYPPPLSHLSFSEVLLVHFRDALGTTFWLSIFTLPVSALVYYSLAFFGSLRVTQFE